MFDRARKALARAALEAAEHADHGASSRETTLPDVVRLLFRYSVSRTSIRSVDLT